MIITVRDGETQKDILKLLPYFFLCLGRNASFLSAVMALCLGDDFLHPCQRFLIKALISYWPLASSPVKHTSASFLQRLPKGPVQAIPQKSGLIVETEIGKKYTDTTGITSCK